MAVVIIKHYFEDGEDRVIGPFASGQAASDWAFKHLPPGLEWYWLPIGPPDPGTV